MDSFAELGSPVRDTARCRSLGALFSLAAASALAGALVACGGGDDDVPAPLPTPAPSPAPAPAPAAPIAAQLAVPTPVGYDADRLAAFNRLNEIRLSAGLGMLAQSTLMDQAAQAHAAWMVANDSFTHDEVAGTVDFTGVNWAERDEASGYVPVEGDELIASASQGAAGVDLLVNGVYHRAGILAFEPVDVGIGWSAGISTNVSTPLVLDLARPGTDAIRGRGQSAQASIGGLAIWPLDGARDVPVRLGLEIPNPVPGEDVLSLGTPVSITVDEGKTISSLSFVIANRATGVVVPAQLLTNRNDPNHLLPESFIAAIPLTTLAPGTTYTVAFSGSALERLSDASERINRSWSFTTAAQ